MFCPQCREPLNDDARFCPQCGNPINKEDSLFMNSNLTKTDKVQEETSLFKKILFVEIIVLIVMLYGMSSYSKKIFCPEYVATKYFEALSNGDINTAYNFLKFDESDFLNKKFYAEQAEYFDSPIKAYSVKCQSDMKTGMTEARVSYQTVDNERKKVFKVSLVKEKKKKYLFFDSWKIEPTNMMADYFDILVPVGAKVYLDSVQLDEKNSEITDESLYTRYHIQNIFEGYYDILVTADGMKDYENCIEIESEESYKVNDMEYTDEYMKQMYEKTAEFAKVCIEALFSRADFNVLRPFASTDELLCANLQMDYEKMLEAMDESITTKKLNVYNAGASLLECSGNQIRIGVMYHYDHKFKEYNPWFGKNEMKEVKGRESSLIVTFSKENDEWVVTHITY